jgi:hypothetical protein
VWPGQHPTKININYRPRSFGPGARARQGRIDAVNAAAKGRLARAWDSAAKAVQEGPAERVDGVPGTPEGYHAWRLGRHVTVLPALVDGAPWEMHLRIQARVEANLTGRCPLCGEVADLSADPERGRVGWAATPVTVGIAHSDGCPTVFDDDDRRWFDPRAVGK